MNTLPSVSVIKIKTLQGIILMMALLACVFLPSAHAQVTCPDDSVNSTSLNDFAYHLMNSDSASCTNNVAIPVNGVRVFSSGRDCEDGNGDGTPTNGGGAFIFVAEDNGGMLPDSLTCDNCSVVASRDVLLAPDTMANVTARFVLSGGTEPVVYRAQIARTALDANGDSSCSILNGSITGGAFGGDAIQPTIVLGALNLQANGTYTSDITLSEVSTDFTAADLTSTHASATLTGSGTTFVATLTPSTAAQVSLFVAAATFTDAADNDNIASNTVTFTGPYNVSGMVSGLVGSGLTLQNNSSDNLSIGTDGSFTFATPLTDGSAYTVTVLNQPTVPSQTCTVNNGTGTVAGINVTNVMVNCTTNTYTVGGTISGLATGNSVVLLNNAGDNLTVNADGSFTFPTALTDRSAYAVTLLNQPTTPNQVCTVTNGSGNLAGADVTDVMVNCVTDTHTISGVVSGLAGSGLTLQNNGGDDLVVSADGSFTFNTALADGSTYAVTVLTQPAAPNQTCSVGNGSGNLVGSNITNVMVTCTTDTHTIAGTVTGLATGNSVILQNNGGDDLTVSANGGFIFATALADGSAYAVTVLTQPTTPNQVCTIASGSGTLAGSDVTDVTITCATDTYTVGGAVSGLTATSTVTLQNNATDDLVVSADGSFIFATALADGSTYDVTVLSQALRTSNLACTPTNNTGQINGANVSDIAVNCTVQTASIQLSDVSIDFNSVTINSTATQTITMSNIGTADLNLSAISLPSAPFSIVSGSCLSLPVVLIPNASCELEVMFAPDGIGNFSGIIDITSDADSSPDQISINGSGSAAGSVAPVSVPTLNIWMLMLLSVLLLSFATMNRRYFN